MAEIWEKDSFINDNILYAFNQEITEYDMKEAGFSLTKEFGLLPDKVIHQVEKLPKDKRKVKLGIIQRDDDIYKKNLKIAFAKARQRFFEANDVDINDILSIKKDAIFMKTHCTKTQLGKYIDFREKNFYSSYILLGTNPKIELYYSPMKLDVKGMKDEMIELHKDGMMHLLNLYFKKMETEEPPVVLDFLRRFIDKYKRRELEPVYYRNFNRVSDFSMIGDDENQYVDWFDHNLDNIDISYNFSQVLLKLVKITL